MRLLTVPPSCVLSRYTQVFRSDDDFRGWEAQATGVSVAFRYRVGHRFVIDRAVEKRICASMSAQ